MCNPTFAREYEKFCKILHFIEKIIVTTQVSPSKVNYSKCPKMLARANAIFDCNIDFLDSLQNYFQPIRSEQTDDRFLISVSSLDCKNTKRKIWDKIDQIVLYCNSFG
jgi:hypothetical protein